LLRIQAFFELLHQKTALLRVKNMSDCFFISKRAGAVFPQRQEPSPGRRRAAENPPAASPLMQKTRRTRGFKRFWTASGKIRQTD